MFVESDSTGAETPIIKNRRVFFMRAIRFSKNYLAFSKAKKSLPPDSRQTRKLTFLKTVSSQKIAPCKCPLRVVGEVLSSPLFVF
jgi:hypothetical protein